MGLPAPLAHGSLRVTVGRATSEEQIDGFLEALGSCVQALRRISPVA